MYRIVIALMFSAAWIINPPIPVSAATCQEAAIPEKSDETVDFGKSIKPFLEQYCIRCHGPKKSESFRVDAREDLLAYIEPGDPDASDIFTSLTTDDEDLLMPPKGEAVRPSKDEIQLVKNWIKQGANWPEGVTLAEPADNVKPAIAENASIGEKLWAGVGALHPAAVHLPIGLLLGAGLFALLGIRGNFVMSDCAYYCLWVGSLTSIVATALGWSYAINKGYGGDFAELFDMEKSIFWHRISGLGVTVASLLLALYAAAARSSDPDDGFLWKLGAMLLAIGVGIVGHQGGELTYGENHYNQLYQAIEEATGLDLGMKADGDAAKQNGDGKSANDQKSDSQPQVGQTTGEQNTKPTGEDPAQNSKTIQLKSDGSGTTEDKPGSTNPPAENKGPGSGGEQSSKAENVG